MSVTDVQHGGNHYGLGSIQPIQYIHANNLNFFEGNCVKYVTRHRNKNGVEDLKKAMHYIQMILEFEYGVISEVNYPPQELDDTSSSEDWEQAFDTPCQSEGTCDTTHCPSYIECFKPEQSESYVCSKQDDCEGCPIKDSCDY